MASAPLGMALAVCLRSMNPLVAVNGAPAREHLLRVLYYARFRQARALRCPKYNQEESQVSDQDFFFEDDKPAKADKASSKAPSKSSSKSAPKGSAKIAAKGGKSSSRPAGKKGKNDPEPPAGQMVTMTIAIMFAVVSLFLGIIIGLYLPKLMGTNIAPGSSTTAPPAASTPSGSDRGIPDNHPDMSNGMGTTAPQ
jgi:hypothetical protein